MNPKFIIEQAWTDSAFETGLNEDGWGIGSKGKTPFIFIIDGCTDYDPAGSGVIFPGGSTSAWWHKEALISAIKGTPRGDEGLDIYIQRIIDKILAEYTLILPVNMRPLWALPCSTLAFVEQIPDKNAIRIATIGDTSVLLRRRDGGVERFPHITSDSKDEKEIANMLHQSSSKAEAETLRRSRREGFIASGRHCISLFPERLGGLEIIELPAQHYSHMLLATDGYMRLLDVFDNFTESTLFTAITEKGLKSLGLALRDMERRSAPTGLTARIKVHDDATAVLVRFTE